MSHCIARVSPMPMAWPLIAAMTGLRTSHAGGCTGEAVKLSPCGAANVSPPGSMSAPAQKARPAPVTTTARTPSSSSHAA
jgi:hypothetical protein